MREYVQYIMYNHGVRIFLCVYMALPILFLVINLSITNLGFAVRFVASTFGLLKAYDQIVLLDISFSTALPRVCDNSQNAYEAKFTAHYFYNYYNYRGWTLINKNSTVTGNIMFT